MNDHTDRTDIPVGWLMPPDPANPRVRASRGGGYPVPVFVFPDGTLRIVPPEAVSS